MVFPMKYACLMCVPLKTGVSAIAWIHFVVACCAGLLAFIATAGFVLCNFEFSNREKRGSELIFVLGPLFALVIFLIVCGFVALISYHLVVATHKRRPGSVLVWAMSHSIYTFLYISVLFETTKPHFNNPGLAIYGVVQVYMLLVVYSYYFHQKKLTTENQYQAVYIVDYNQGQPALPPSYTGVQQPSVIVKQPYTSQQSQSFIVKQPFNSEQSPSSIVEPPPYTSELSPSFVVKPPYTSAQSPSSIVELPPYTSAQSPSFVVKPSYTSAQSPSFIVKPPYTSAQSPSFVVKPSYTSEQPPSFLVTPPSTSEQSPSSIVEPPPYTSEQSPSSIVEPPPYTSEETPSSTVEPPPYTSE